MINKELLKTECAKIGVILDDTALVRFDTFAQSLVSWNNHINLTSITEPDEIVIKHFIDSLMLFKYVHIEYGSSLIDVGCGAGFPGIPIFIARPDLEVTFLDSLRKRLSFIKEIMFENGQISTRIHARAEELSKDKEHREKYDVATSRAVAPLNVLVEYCLPYVKVGGLFIALKGSEDEVSNAMDAITLLGGKLEQNVPDILPNGDERHIVVIRKVSQTPTKYPRRTKKITSSPL